MTYAYFGTMRTQPGKRDEVVQILLRASAAVGEHGCHAYIVGVADDPDLICVSELWESREAHDLSLLAPETREAIASAMPMLTGEFSGQEMTVLGGLGAPDIHAGGDIGGDVSGDAGTGEVR